jgi:hypothetical protein
MVLSITWIPNTIIHLCYSDNNKGFRLQIIMFGGGNWMNDGQCPDISTHDCETLSMKMH